MRGRVAAGILLAVASAMMAATDERPGTSDRILARWNDGELSEQAFIASIDPDGVALRRGGDYLEKQLCKAVYRTIYGKIGETAGIDSSGPFLEALDVWRTNHLASAFVTEHRPPMRELVPETRLMEYYRENLDRLYTSTGLADISVLFIRCGDDPVARVRCRAEMATVNDLVGRGETDFADVIALERARSGAANGSFEEVPLDSLVEVLRQVIVVAPIGSFSPVVETPIGLFWVRVDARVDPAPIPFDNAEVHLRTVLERQAAADWRLEEVRRLRGVLVLPPSTSDDEVLAAAAVAEGLDQDGVFLRAEFDFKEWKLADLAFYEDRKILPDDEDVAARIARAEEDSRFRRYHIAWIYLTVGDDRYLSLQRVEQLEAILGDGGSPLGARDFAARHRDVVLVELHDITLENLSRISHELAEKVPSMTDGGWEGPVAYPKGRVIPGDILGQEEAVEFPPGMALMVRRSSRLPSVDEVRDEVNASFRNEITDVAKFKEVFASRWGLVMTIDGDSGSP